MLLHNSFGHRVVSQKKTLQQNLMHWFCPEKIFMSFSAIKINNKRKFTDTWCKILYEIMVNINEPQTRPVQKSNSFRKVNLGILVLYWQSKSFFPMRQSGDTNGSERLNARYAEAAPDVVIRVLYSTLLMEKQSWWLRSTEVLYWKNYFGRTQLFYIVST